MSRPEFIDECIDCGKKIHNSDCRFFLCPECREKEKKIPTKVYSLQELHRIAKNVVKNNAETIFLNSLCEELIKHNKVREFLRGFSLVLSTETIRCGLFAIKESDKSIKIHREIMGALADVKK